MPKNDLKEDRINWRNITTNICPIPFCGSILNELEGSYKCSGCEFYISKIRAKNKLRKFKGIRSAKIVEKPVDNSYNYVDNIVEKLCILKEKQFL